MEHCLAPRFMKEIFCLIPPQPRYREIRYVGNALSYLGSLGINKFAQSETINT